MKKFWVGFIIVIVIMIIMNPSKEEHIQDFMKTAMKETGYDVNSGNSDLERGMVALGYSLAFNTMSNVTTYKNFGIFSILSKDGNIGSIGCMGFIYNRIKGMEDDTGVARLEEVPGTLKEISKMIIFADYGDNAKKYNLITDLNYKTNMGTSVNLPKDCGRASGYNNADKYVCGLYFAYFIEKRSGYNDMYACAVPIDENVVPLKYKKVCMNRKFELEYVGHEDPESEFQQNSLLGFFLILIGVFSIVFLIWILNKGTK